MSHKVSKKHIATSFSRGASTYEEHAGIQRKALERLVGRMGEYPCPDGPWADLGCGTGLLGKLLPSQRPDRPIVGVDIAWGALSALRAAVPGAYRPVVGDIEALPLADESFSRVVLASVLQWLPHPENILGAIRKTLLPGGQLLFAVFLEDYLKELLTTRAAMGYHAPIHHYSQEQFGTLLGQAGFRLLWSERIRQEVYYPGAMAVIRTLVGMGATATRGSDQSRHDLFDLCREYERRYRTDQGVPATEDILVGIAAR